MMYAAVQVTCDLELTSYIHMYVHDTYVHCFSKNAPTLKRYSSKL